MAYQNLFEALHNVCGFIALESDMFEIINAYEKDKAEQLPQADVITAVCQTCGTVVENNIVNCDRCEILRNEM
jgi:hypothetical protein